MGYIYTLIDTRNGKKYIGKHIGNDKNYWSGGLIPNRIAKKHGKDIFDRIILEDSVPDEILNEKEIFYIKQYNSIEDGYNLTIGGEGGDTISNNPNKIVIVDKIKKSLQGRVFDDEHKKKLRENHMSKDPLNRKKLSDALKGLPKSDEHKRNISRGISEYNKKIKRWCGDDNPLKNEEIKVRISEKNKERGELRRIENINNFIHDFTNNLIDKTNIKKYKYKLFIWKRDLGEEKLNSMISKNIMDGFIKIYEEIKNKNIDTRFKNFVGFKHSETTKEKLSNYRKDNFFNFCYDIVELMKSKNLEYLNDLYDKKTYNKTIKKIKKSKFLIYLNDEIKEILFKVKPKLNKNSEECHTNLEFTNEKKKVSIDGVIYESIAYASKKLSVDRGVIRYRLKSKNFLTYIYI